MRFRVAGLIKHPKTGMYGFRMAVPDRHRSALNLREIKESYGTRCKVEALHRHATKLIEVTALFARLDGDVATGVDEDAKRICREGFETLARRNLARHDDGVTTLRDAEENVIIGMLTVLAFRARCSWGEDHRIRAELHLLGDSDDEQMPATTPAAISDPDHQDEVVERINALEGRFVTSLDGAGNEISVLCTNPKTRGLAYREIAAGLLRRRDWKFVELEVMVVAEAAQAPVRIGQRLYDALAERITTKLASFRDDKTAAILMPRASTAVHAQGDPSMSAGVDNSNRTLRDAFEQWCKNRGITLDDNGKPIVPNKTADEWALAYRRMNDLFGPIYLHQITAQMVHQFRDVLTKLPSRPKAAVGRLPLRKQVLIAEEKKLRTLNPNSVKKQVTAIQTMLTAAVNIDWITRNVAENVTVAGAGHTGDERDFFTLEELRMIFASPLMTDPGSCGDSMFFIILLETLQGGRPGEFAKLKPEEIGIFDLIPTIRIRRTEGRTQKSKASVRDIPLHELGIKAGILELAAIRREEGAAWLFNDLEPDKYGDRYKLLSRKINRQLRELGIKARDKSFYSARHAYKRESRRQDIPEEHSDQMSGNATGGTGRKYGKGVPLETLKKGVDRVKYRSVDWDPVIRCGLFRIARLRSHNARAAYR